MPSRKIKSSKAAAAPAQSAVREKALHALAPWSCKHYGDRSEIEAYVMAAGDWQTIAEVRQTASTNAEEAAEFIARIANNFEKTMNLLDDMITALELCIECKGLDWSAENEVDIVLRRARLMQKPILPTSGTA